MMMMMMNDYEWNKQMDEWKKEMAWPVQKELLIMHNHAPTLLLHDDDDGDDDDGDDDDGDDDGNDDDDDNDDDDE